MFRNLGHIVLIFLFLLSGCSSGESKFTGTVYQIDNKNNRILVVNGITDQDLEIDIKDLLISKKYKEISWFSGIDPNKFEVKDEVEIWYSTMEDSYPSQSSANKVRKIK